VIHVALIGAGGHSLSCHAPALQHFAAQHPEAVRLAALCDLNLAMAQQAAEQFGFARACASIDDLFRTAERIDAIVAILPFPVIQASTGRLLPRRLPLLIEKPLGRTIAEARAISAMITREDAASRVMVSMNRRFDPGLAMGLEWTRRQGPFRHVHASMRRTGRTEPDFVWGTGIHLIDALNYVAGPLRLHEDRTLCPGRPAAGPDCWRVATFTGRDDCTVVLDILPDSGGWEESIRIAGKGYHVEIHSGVYPPWRVRAWRGMQMELDASSAADAPVFISNGSLGETSAFLDAVSAGRPLPGPSVAEALASSELAAQLQDLL